MRSHISQILLLSLLMTCASPAIAQTPEELIEVRNAYAQAMNEHDFEKMRTYLAEGFLYDLVRYPAPFGVDIYQMGIENGQFQDPTWHTDEGYVGAVDHIVVVDHNAVSTLDGGFISPHLDIYEFEGGLIKKATTYGDALQDAVREGLMPAPVLPPLVPVGPVPDPEPTGLTPVEAIAEKVRIWNALDYDAMAKLYHADCRIKAGPLVMTLNRDEIIALNQATFQAFPAGDIEVVRTIDLGDGWVVSELVSNGVHSSPFMGVPASGYPLRLRMVWLLRFTDAGLIIQGSFHYDGLTLLTQMTTPPIPLDGIWLTAAPTPMGNWVTKTLYIAQDAAKTRYSGTLEAINAMPLMGELYPDADPALFYSVGGQAEAVGRDKYLATYLSYERKIDHETGSVVIVGMNTLQAQFEVTAPDLLHGQGTAAYYLASQDADGDGFPDEGEEPVACFPWQWTSKRLMQMPGCVPAPMP